MYNLKNYFSSIIKSLLYNLSQLTINLSSYEKVLILNFFIISYFMGLLVHPALDQIGTMQPLLGVQVRKGSRDSILPLLNKFQIIIKLDVFFCLGNSVL